MNDFEIMDKMAINNMDIVCCPPSNFKRANTGKQGFGEIVMACGNEQIMNLDNYLPILYLVNAEVYGKLKTGE